MAARGGRKTEGNRSIRGEVNEGLMAKIRFKAI